MSAVLLAMTVLAVVAVALAAFVRTDPARLASTLRLTGPVVLGLLGLAAALLGRAGLGGMLVSGALAWYAAGRRRSAAKKTPGRRSMVRTAALEMELDHDTGGLEGMVLAGRYEHRVLGTMEMKEVLDLYAELAGDSESRQLIEAYLDGRFPAWREHLDPDHGDRHGVAPGSGAMTKEEAYKVLGLEAGAAAADVRKAHRRLMQRLHPDLGGTSFLASRINEAKDVLLSNHN
jgi:hypothetical protein